MRQRNLNQNQAVAAVKNIRPRRMTLNAMDLDSRIQLGVRLRAKSMTGAHFVLTTKIRKLCLYFLEVVLKSKI